MIGFRAMSLRGLEGQIVAPPAEPTVLRLAIANAGAIPSADYKYNTETLEFSKQTGVDVQPTSNGACVRVSPTGKWMLFGTINTPYNVLYKRVNNVWVKFSELAVAGRVNGACFSHDDTHLIMSHNSAPYVTIYEIVGDTFTQVTFTSHIASNGLAAAYHPTLDIFISSHQGAPNVVCYQKVGNTYELLNTPYAPPQSVGYGCRFSPDGTLAVVATGGGPTAVLYRFDENGFGDRFAGDIPIAGYSARTALLTNDNQYLVVGHLTTPFWSYIQVNPTAGTYGASLPVPTLPSYGIYADLSPAGDILAIARYGAGYLSIFRLNGDTITSIPYGSSPNNNGAGANFYLTVE